jgi:hypothetical protein
MSRRAAALGIAAVVLVALALLLWSQYGSDGPDQVALQPEPIAEPTANGTPVELFFPGTDGWLHPELRELALPENPRERIALLVQKLLQGPTSGSYVVPLPSSVELEAVHLNPGGVAYLRLRESAGSRPPSSGSRTEMLRVYSLVNTVLRNVPQARSVVLLWNGEQLRSFAGHLDTSRPLVARETLVRVPS